MGLEVLFCPALATGTCWETLDDRNSEIDQKLWKITKSEFKPLSLDQ